jgi:23S rRNA (guanosine2251-2'-O)-methyltransferase
MYYIGPHACDEALRFGKLQTIRMIPSVWDRYENMRIAARAAGVVVHSEPTESLDRRCQGRRHQGIIGEGADITFTSMDTLLSRVEERGADALILMLDGIQDPNNFGAILRSAAGAGVDGVIFPERRSAQVNDAVIRASAGTAGQVPLVRVVNLTRTIKDLQNVGVWVYGLTKQDGSRSYLEETFDRATLFILGSEGSGLHHKIQEHCDVLLTIGMPGNIESLNVSNAAAIALFRVLAQRQIG